MHIHNFFYIKTFYVCALVGVLIKWRYEMHGATITINKLTFKTLRNKCIGYLQADLQQLLRAGNSIVFGFTLVFVLLMSGN